jgi:hypothetical protein
MKPATGKTSRMNSVMLGLMTSIATSKTRIMIGFFRNISSEDMIEFSTSLTSPVMREMMSPLRSSEKKGRASLSILL